MEIMKGRSPHVLENPEISETDDPEKQEVMVWPSLTMRLLICFLFTTLVLLIFSYLSGAPLEEFANPNKPTNPAKAPWYFLGLQELVAYSAAVGGVYAPTLAVLGLMSIPYVDRETSNVGIWFHDNKAVAIGLVSAVFIFVFVPISIGANNAIGVRVFYPDSPQWIVDIFNPATAIVGVMAAMFFLILFITKSTRQASMGLFSAYLSAYLVLTLVGTIWRGPNWVWVGPEWMLLGYTGY